MENANSHEDFDLADLDKVEVDERQLAQDLVLPELNIVKGNKKAVMKQIGATSNDLWSLPVEGSNLVILPNYNPRLKRPKWEARVTDMVESLLADGWHDDSPISVISARINGEEALLLKRGHTRWEAVKRANAILSQRVPKTERRITHVTAVCTQQRVTEEAMYGDTVRSNTDSELEPYEKAIICNNLRTLGCDTETIERYTGIKAAYVKDLLTLMDGPMKIRQLVRDGRIAVTRALKMLREHDVNAVSEVEKQVARADAAGKKRVTAKFVAGHMYHSAIRKAAPSLRTIVADVKSDPGFSALAPATRQKIEEMTEQLEKVRKMDEEKNGPIQDPEASSEPAVDPRQQSLAV